MFFSRDYPLGLINGAIGKSQAIPRQKALLQVPRQPTILRPAFVVSYDPRLPGISSITKRHWRLLVSQEEYIMSVFPEPASPWSHLEGRKLSEKTLSEHQIGSLELLEERRSVVTGWHAVMLKKAKQSGAVRILGQQPSNRSPF